MDILGHEADLGHLSLWPLFGVWTTSVAFRCPTGGYPPLPSLKSKFSLNHFSLPAKKQLNVPNSMTYGLHSSRARSPKTFAGKVIKKIKSGRQERWQAPSPAGSRRENSSPTRLILLLSAVICFTARRALRSSGEGGFEGRSSAPDQII